MRLESQVQVITVPIFYLIAHSELSVQVLAYKSGAGGTFLCGITFAALGVSSGLPSSSFSRIPNNEEIQASREKTLRQLHHDSMQVSTFFFLMALDTCHGFEIPMRCPICLEHFTCFDEELEETRLQGPVPFKVCSDTI